MADNTNQQTFPNSISQEELASRIAEEYDLPREEALKVLDGIAKLSGSRTVYLKSDTGTGTGFLGMVQSKLK